MTGAMQTNNGRSFTTAPLKSLRTSRVCTNANVCKESLLRAQQHSCRLPPVYAIIIHLLNLVLVPELQAHGTAWILIYAVYDLWKQVYYVYYVQSRGGIRITRIPSELKQSDRGVRARTKFSTRAEFAV